ncbi:MAG: preprotein translocase subunit YajC [Verrucomicrobiia bacterium]|jgi:preprotein translocase subunit YajC
MNLPSLPSILQASALPTSAFSLQPSAFPLAMGAPAQPGENPTKSLLGALGPMILIFVVFYLILIRPQQKQQKEARKMLEALKVGDRVLVAGGIYGMVAQLKEKSVVVKIAENTRVEILRSAIQQVLPEESGGKA